MHHLFFVRRKHKTRTFFFFSWTLIQSFRIQLKVKFANIWRIERVGISARKFEGARVHFFKWRFLGGCLRSLLYEQQRYKTGTSRPHTSKILPERLVERVWGTRSQSSVDSSSRSYLSTSATVRISVHTALKSGTEPIRNMTFHFRDRRGAPSLCYKIAPKFWCLQTRENVAN